MKVIVVCEESGIVRDAFRALGHDAWSIDLQPCSGDPTYHIQGNVLDHDLSKYDLMIAHPPCTYLANSGVRWLKDAGSEDATKQRWAWMESAADFFKWLLYVAPVDYKAIENPIMHGYGLGLIGRRYDQLIHPFQFGHDERKATCLWLDGLPRLVPTKVMPPPYKQSIWKMPPSKDRGKLRSKTFPGIAQAMAEQWSTYIERDVV